MEEVTEIDRQILAEGLQDALLQAQKDYANNRKNDKTPWHKFLPTDLIYDSIYNAYITRYPETDKNGEYNQQTRIEWWNNQRISQTQLFDNVLGISEIAKRLDLARNEKNTNILINLIPSLIMQQPINKEVPTAVNEKIKLINKKIYNEPFSAIEYDKWVSEKKLRNQEKKHEEEMTEMKKHENEKQNERLAKKTNDLKDIQQQYDELDQKLKTYQFKESLRDYISDKVKNGSYKLDKDDLLERLETDKGNGIITDDNIETVANQIYLQGNYHVIKNKRRIAELARLQGYNPNEYAKLPAETQQEINDYIVNKFNEDLRKKNMRYLLPKQRPRWEKAQVLFKVSPNLGKGAWSI